MRLSVTSCQSTQRGRGCSSCGCYRRCGSISRGGTFYERRYVEREYVERRYGYGGYRRHYGYYPYGGGGYGYRRPWGNGYGGVGRDTSGVVDSRGS